MANPLTNNVPGIETIELVSQDFDSIPLEFLPNSSKLVSSSSLWDWSCFGLSLKFMLCHETYF